MDYKSKYIKYKNKYYEVKDAEQYDGGMFRKKNKIKPEDRNLTINHSTPPIQSSSINIQRQEKKEKLKLIKQLSTLTNKINETKSKINNIEVDGIDFSQLNINRTELDKLYNIETYKKLPLNNMGVFLSTPYDNANQKMEEISTKYQIFGMFMSTGTIIGLILAAIGISVITYGIPLALIAGGAIAYGIATLYMKFNKWDEYLAIAPVILVTCLQMLTDIVKLNIFYDFIETKYMQNGIIPIQVDLNFNITTTISMASLYDKDNILNTTIHSRKTVSTKAIENLPKYITDVYKYIINLYDLNQQLIKYYYILDTNQSDDKIESIYVQIQDYNNIIKELREYLTLFYKLINIGHFCGLDDIIYIHNIIIMNEDIDKKINNYLKYTLIADNIKHMYCDCLMIKILQSLHSIYNNTTVPISFPTDFLEKTTLIYTTYKKNIETYINTLITNKIKETDPFYKYSKNINNNLYALEKKCYYMIYTIFNKYSIYHIITFSVIQQLKNN